MNTQQLKEVLKKDPVAYAKFCGVYAENTLPRRVTSFPSGYIANTDPDKQPGRHWVAFYLSSPQQGEFFDSYGHPPQVYSSHFVKFLDQNVQEWTFNNKQLQSNFTNVCGDYCIFYLLHRARGVSMNSIVNLFSSNKERNDVLVYDYVMRLWRQ